MNTPTISVIVPIYNVESVLRRCLDSVVNQTYRNLEIILVDDGSTDQCGAICDEYALRDSRIRVLHQEFAGVSAARNAGLDMMTGDYIMWVDSDDWIEREACATVLSIAKEQHADMVCFGFREVFPSGEIKIWGTDAAGEVEKTEKIRQLVWNSPGNSVWEKFYAKEVFDGIRFPKGRIWEDACVVHELVHRAHSIYATDTVLYNYIRRKGSIADSRYTPQSIKDILYVWNIRLKFLEQHYPAYTDKMLKEILRQMIIGHELLKGDAEYDAFLSDFDEFVRQYRPRFRTISKGCRLNQLYCSCPSLAYLYVRWFFRKQMKKL